VSLPFTAQPKETLLKQMAIWRMLDLKAFSGKKIDLVICTKYPSYMINHHNKVCWLIHQHRQIYDLYDSPYTDFTNSKEDEALRQMIVGADQKALKECKAVYTISPNVTSRIKRYLNIESEALTPPLPLGESYYNKEAEDYILSVGRICTLKRVDLIVKALPLIDSRLKLKIVGSADEPAIENYLKGQIDKHQLWPRVELLGRGSDQQLVDLYAGAKAVYYAPFDEDYGFVTIEALASGKPVITAKDSGGVLQFIENEVNGLVVEPTEQAIANAVNRLVEDEILYQRLQKNCSAETLTSSWDKIINSLTSHINGFSIPQIANESPNDSSRISSL
jgi:glycosyltransferase involved in cell wall biosynthesis